MPLTRANTISIIKNAMDGQSNNPNTNPAEARQVEATALGNVIFDAMIGRQVTVIGVTSDGATFNAVGTIIE